MSNWKSIFAGRHFSANIIWVIRYWLGIAMMYHSYEVLFFGGLNGFAQYLETLGVPYPYVLAPVAKTSEFFGGLLLILNIGSRIAASLVFSVMFIAVFVAHEGLILSDAELAFNYLLMALILVLNPNIPFRLIKIR